MKKIQLFLVAAVIVAAGSAFTGIKKQNTDPLYKAVYNGTSFNWELITGPEGICEASSNYCKARFASQPVANQVPTAEELVTMGDYQ